MAKVLIIDDDYAFAEYAQILLDSFGHQTVVCLEGSKAYEMALSEKPDVILTDLGMPEVSGLDVMRQLKEDPRTKSIPVLVCSMTQSPAEVEAAMSLGGVAFLSKPLKTAELSKRVKEVTKPA